MLGFDLVSELWSEARWSPVWTRLLISSLLDDLVTCWVWALTWATGHCHNNFNQWKCRFLWKLCYQWLKGLRHHQIAIVRQDPGHQHAWYWPCLRVVKWSEIVTCMDGYWYQACWWPGDILSQVITRLDIDLVSELWSEVRLSLVWTVTDIKPADDLVTYWARSSAGLILT